ncbi:hypothetical protein HHK36_015883 [Tetracentron sinense]|uniref:60S ribosomal protein L7a n=1 Tax=Tetracentron sinense TaxID=13715 RepID=A0A834Z3W9_TETSI|nr:hypothetical protein HHK36_015883 [Tetracentron sinense]
MQQQTYSRCFLKYMHEDKAANKERLLKRAQAEAEGKTVEVKKPIVMKYGLNHITYLIEHIANFNDKYEENQKKWGGGIKEVAQRMT